MQTQVDCSSLGFMVCKENAFLIVTNCCQNYFPYLSLSFSPSIRLTWNISHLFRITKELHCSKDVLFKLHMRQGRNEEKEVIQRNISESWWFWKYKLLGLSECYRISFRKIYIHFDIHNLHMKISIVSKPWWEKHSVKSLFSTFNNAVIWFVRKSIRLE